MRTADTIAISLGGATHLPTISQKNKLRDAQIPQIGETTLGLRMEDIVVTFGQPDETTRDGSTTIVKYDFGSAPNGIAADVNIMLNDGVATVFSFIFRNLSTEGVEVTLTWLRGRLSIGGYRYLKTISGALEEFKHGSFTVLIGYLRNTIGTLNVYLHIHAPALKKPIHIHNNK